MTDTDVVTVPCVGEYLEVETRTIHRLVATGGIPGFRASGSWHLGEGGIDLRIQSNTVGRTGPGTQVESDR